MRRWGSDFINVAALASLAACAGGGVSGTGEGPGGKADDPGGRNAVDVLATTLFVDVQNREAQAILEVQPTGQRVSLEVDGLDVTDVFGTDTEFSHSIKNGRLQIDTPSDKPFEVVVNYKFEVQTEFNGLLDNGSTVVWPYHCGNLFPCASRPSDGLTFEMFMENVPEDSTAIFPEAIVADAPSYTIAWAVGDYTCEALGTTDAGTAAKVCWLPQGKTKALAGAANLVGYMDWFEKNMGPYTFGPEVASVSVAWGGGAAGGMEHHPFWHIATDAMDDPATHAHEAAHGWYGTGVRIGCWEDFVLSEGTVSYLTARAITEVDGPEAGDAIWASYREELDFALEVDSTLAWPDSCGSVDILDDGLFSNIVYMKGAFFYRAVAEQTGVGELDAALSSFYQIHVGQAARMKDMLAHIERETGFDPTDLAEFWLRTAGDPFKD